ncbi:ABC transporter permease [Clostridium polynesiense]|uniref:ABC transporter permease n=1 Tax=Clostridium polynesiense TaxID=1325933 RepID=UPI00058B6F79|nr:ABC transporter permease [Clostridium polynesiense]
MFEILPADEKVQNEIVRPSISYWQDAWRRLKKNKLAIVSLIFIIIITIMAIAVPAMSKFDYRTNNLDISNQLPSAEHWFGTDHLGRDMFVRVMFGARYSLIIAFVASLLNFIIGILYGGISGYVGGTTDNLMMRVVDILYSIPMMIYVIIIMSIIGAGLFSIIIALAISYWLSMARIVRGEVLQLKQQEFVLAAKVLGASNWRILLRHLIPNCIGPIIVTLTLLIPQAIFTESFLSFIGLGLSAPRASWGTLASDAMQGLYVFPYQLLFPSLAICFTILAFNLLGDGLRDSLDPRMRR